MGMDPIVEGETYEVTIQVEGPLNIHDFREFRKELHDFLDKFSGKPAAPPNPAVPGKPNSHKKYNTVNPRPVIQVREARGGQRKNAP